MKQRPLGMKRPKVLAAATAAATVVALVGAGSWVFAQDNGLEDQTYSAGTYIIQVEGEPVATYDGDVDGYSATGTEDGERLDTQSKSADRYRNYLEKLREDVMGQVPGVSADREFDTVMNGFSADLSADEAKKMAKADGVTQMWRNEILKPDTSTTPDFLGLSGEDGVWANQFNGDEHAGEGTIIADIDSGFWPENPSFGELPEPRPDADIIDSKWNGTCDEGDDENADHNITCNNKVIGARYYNQAGADTGEGEAKSPRDFGGHGTHTAGTAAGNHGVDAGEYGTLSGMAPAARLAVYKVCWETTGGCATTDSVAAIEDAVNDGADVINFSISGSPEYIIDPVHVAFFNAAAAGVFVANSAGNSGPTESTVAHNTPWITTVAASTHDRGFEASVTLGDGQTITGAGKGEAVDETNAVLSSEVGIKGASEQEATECHLDSLDKDKVDGRIVACARGTNARTEKSQAVADAGGTGMILYNVEGDANDIAADDHAVPSVHVTAANGTKIVSYLEETGDDATATLAAGEQVTQKAPEMADFSSTGPAIAGGGDLLKPDITAPGVDVIAAVAPPGNDDADFASYQGTSMSSPHIAGLGALMKSKNPDWSPSTIRSAMMTTASQTDNEGDPIQRNGENATPFDYGAGHVEPTSMFDPGLVYDSGPVDWLEYGCAIDQFQQIGYEDLCNSVESIDPSNMNYPSIAIGDLAGKQEVTRTVTNVSDKTTTYFSRIEDPKGVDVKIDTKSLTLKPGESADFTVTFTRTDAAFSEYQFGSLTWEDLNGHKVTSPLAIQPVALAMDDEVTADGADEGMELNGKVGFDGELTATASDLVPSDVNDFTLTNPVGGSFDTANPTESDHTKAVEVEVPKEASLSRFATFDADHPNGTDLDLYVYQKDGDQLSYLGASASGGSDESATLPGGATYVIYVDLWSGEASTDIAFHSWIVDGEDGNMTVDPESQKVSTSDKVKLDVAWSDLESDARYLGTITYGNGDEKLGSTIINVNT